QVEDLFPGYTPPTPPDSGTLVSWSITVSSGVFVQGPTNPGNFMDQNANGVTGETPGDIYADPKPLDPLTPYQPPAGFFARPFDSSALPLIVPGRHIISTSVPGQSASSDNLAQNTAVSSVDVVFDRDMDPNSFTGADVVRMMGPAGQVGPVQTFAAAL